MVMQVPQVVQTEDYDVILSRVAAVDVAKATGKVCVRLPDQADVRKRITTVWDVAATTSSIMELGARLVAQGVERVVVESTSDYWRPFFYLLEAQGLQVWLVNARQARQAPGRPKTDKLDAVWLAKLTERGMLRPSFVPPPSIRRLRGLTRARHDLVGDLTRCKQRLEKLLEDALIKLSVVASDLFGVSCRLMLQALIEGERDPHALAGLARGRLKAKHSALVHALHGRFDDHHAQMARMLLQQHDFIQAQINELTATIEAAIALIAPAHSQPAQDQPAQDQPAQPPPLPVVARLDEITGVGPEIAQAIIAEIGLDMGVFPTAQHLVSWAKLSPRTHQSGAKTRHGRTGKGNPYLKAALGQAAAATARTDTFLGHRYRRLVARRGKLKALVAVARSILTIVWHLLANPRATFRDLGPDHYTQHIDQQRRTRNLVRQLQALGYQVSLNQAD
jgi:transposase